MIGLVIQMSGKRKIIIEEGTSRDHRYDRYLYWKKEIFDENTGEGVKYTPTYEEECDDICEYLLHEAYNDFTRDRKPDFPRKLKMIRECLNNIEDHVKNSNHGDIPKIYFETNRKLIDKNYTQYEKDIELFKNRRLVG